MLSNDLLSEGIITDIKVNAIVIEYDSYVELQISRIREEQKQQLV